MAEKFATSVNAAHIYTSAKKNEGIEELFVKLTTNILKKHTKPDAAPPRLLYIYLLNSVPFLKLLLF